MTPLASRKALTDFLRDRHSALLPDDGDWHGFRADVDGTSLFFRVQPSPSDYDVYCWAYKKDWLDDHMQKAENGIRFIDSGYNDKFTIPDGGKIKLNFSDGTSEEKTCRYIDDTHVQFGDGSGAYGLQHICEFAERLEKIGATVEPVTEPMVKLTERFYCPLKLAVFERDEYGDLEEDGYDLDGRFAAQYEYEIKSSHAEYRGMMMYLTKSGVSLLEIALSSEKEYFWIKKQMFSRSQTHYLETVLDRSRELIQNNDPGSNVLRYLLHTMNNKVIKNQFSKDPNNRLSDLRMQYGCIPFDVMPFASSLIQHIPGNSELFGCIEPEGRDHEFLARFLNENMNANSSLYTRQTEIVDKFSDVDNLIKTFNSKLYEKHRGRSIEMFGKNIYIKEAYDNTKEIIEKLNEYAKNGMQGYDESITSWINTQDAIDSEEKTRILEKMFSKSCVTLIYGAAGTGKTYLVNHISQFLDEYATVFSEQSRIKKRKWNK